MAQRPRQDLWLLTGPDGRRGALPAEGGTSGTPAGVPRGTTAAGTLPGLYPEWLGSVSFCHRHRVRFPYVAGEMANGISTTALVIAMARANMLAFFGAAGLGVDRIGRAVEEMRGELGPDRAWGVNLIHQPQNPRGEEQLADLLISMRVPHMSAAAFMELTPAVVRCAAAGLRELPDGQVVRPRSIFAKVSRTEVARRFLSPAPEPMLRHLADRGLISSEEHRLAGRVAVADNVTVEADSGGHTDSQSLVAVLPHLLSLRTELARRHRLITAPHMGAAGGLGTPQGVAAAFVLGADYVLTGSINQISVEAGISDAAKDMLAAADIADVIRAPASDMFEIGAKVQVLGRNSMFGVRATRLYWLYEAYPSIEALPDEDLAWLEQDVLRTSTQQVWQACLEYWAARDPDQVDRAADDPHHRMALVFRWYLGQASRWAINGTADRQVDYQLWCGPALGAFNRWTAGSFLAVPAHRTVVQIARNLMEGAAVVTRTRQLHDLGLPVSSSDVVFTPRPLL
ncbi:PfaD family polyunsaturated fatty acid/polyketide biosynthesis protein [Streptomyces chartreusis]|uniref:PfaD family polyunsaturated fatty acid/polyketide biosynthesis protein n=1 Tax=Streptomyces chartreusis TaxID=1969 RepID=UPI00382C3AAC